MIMSKPNPRTAAAITLRDGASAIADLETQHRMAERALSGAEGALQEASAKYDAALGEGREAALAARQVRTTAEVDLDIARRNVDTLGRKLADAHEALRLAGIEHKRTEAERLRSMFEEMVRQGLARLGRIGACHSGGAGGAGTQWSGNPRCGGVSQCSSRGGQRGPTHPGHAVDPTRNAGALLRRDRARDRPPRQHRLPPQPVHVGRRP